MIRNVYQPMWIDSGQDCRIESQSHAKPTGLNPQLDTTVAEVLLENA